MASAAQSVGSAPRPTRPKHRRQFRNYLLDKRLQLHYVLAVGALSAAVTSILGYLMYDQKSYATRMVGKALEGFADESLRDGLMGNLARDDQNLIFTMGAFGVGLLVVISLILIVLTHKVAGPLYKMGRHFDQLRDGDYAEIWGLRPGDELQDVFAHFKSMHDALRARRAEEVATYDGFVAACRAVGTGGPLATEVSALEQHAEQRRASLEQHPPPA